MKQFFINLKTKSASVWLKHKRKLIVTGIIVGGSLLMTQCPKQGAVIIKNSAEITDILIEVL